MDLYAENILDHYKHPRKKESLVTASISHEEKNLSCGDGLKIDLLIENGKVMQLGWTGDGCAISQAAMSILAEELEGKSLSDIDAMTPKNMYDLLGVPVGPRRFKCALLCLHTLKNALNLYNGKPVQSWTETVAVDS